MRILAEYEITFKKRGRLTKITLASGQKYKIERDGKTKNLNPSEIKVGDKISGFEILKIKLPVLNTFEKGKKFNKIPVLNNLNDFRIYMDKTYPEGEWDVEKEKEKLDEFGIASIRFLYMGLLIENIFGCSLYVPGRILKDKFEFEPKLEPTKIKEPEYIEVE